MAEESSSSTNIELCLARAEHEQAIAQLLHNGQGAEPLTQLAARWRNFAARPALRQRIWVGHAGQRLVCVAWSLREWSAGAASQQLRIHVDRGFRRRGLGSQLLKLLSSQAAPALTQSCEIPPAAKVARAFLAHHGFQGAPSLLRMQRPLLDSDAHATPARHGQRRASTDRDWQRWLELRREYFAGALHLSAIALEDACALAATAGCELEIIENEQEEWLGYVHHSARESSQGMGLIVELAVAPAHRRRGLGRALVQHSLRRFVEQGLTSAELFVEQSAQAARKLYRGLGFQPTTSLECWQRRVP